MALPGTTCTQATWPRFHWLHPRSLWSTALEPAADLLESHPQYVGVGRAKILSLKPVLTQALPKAWHLWTEKFPEPQAQIASRSVHFMAAEVRDSIPSLNLDQVLASVAAATQARE